MSQGCRKRPVYARTPEHRYGPIVLLLLSILHSVGFYQAASRNLSRIIF